MHSFVVIAGVCNEADSHGSEFYLSRNNSDKNEYIAVLITCT